MTSAASLARTPKRGRETKRRPTPGNAVYVDGAAHQFHELTRNRQTQSGATVATRGRIIGLLKCLEDAALFFRRDSDACVPHLEGQQSGTCGLFLSGDSEYDFPHFGET